VELDSTLSFGKIGTGFRKSKKTVDLESKSHDNQMFAQPHTVLPLHPSSRPAEFPSTFQALSQSNFDLSMQYSYIIV
jgi:hypothetical protein